MDLERKKFGMRTHPVELSEAQAFLHGRFGDRVAHVAHLGAGAWSRAYSFDLDGQELVARFGQHREDFDLDRQAAAFASPELPIPAVLEIGNAFEGAFAISERAHGVFLESLDTAGWRLILPALFRGLDRLRTYPTSWPADWTVEGSGLTNVVGGLWGAQLLSGLVDRPGQRVSGWRSVLRDSPELDELFETTFAAFSDLLERCPTEPHLIHSDLLNRNVLVSEDASEVRAVFDWGCLKYGDFLYEVAWFTFCEPWHPGLAAIDIRSAAVAHYDTTGVRVPGFDERMRCYELHIALDHLAYNAFTGSQDDLIAVANRTRAILETPLDAGKPEGRSLP